jgi:hypothetical protein
MKKKGELTVQIEDLADRMNSLLKHTQNVKVEQQQNQVCMQQVVIPVFDYNYFLRRDNSAPYISGYTWCI